MNFNLSEGLGTVSYISELDRGHVIRILVNEHRILYDHLHGMDEIKKQIFNLESPLDHPELFVKLIHLADHLNHVDKHHAREELLYSILKKLDGSSHIEVLKSEHEFLTDYKRKFSLHIQHMEAMDFKSYKLQMNYMANGIIGILREHIYLENQSVFPNALNVIKDESTWSELKDEFDEIGYYFEKMMLL